MARWSIGRDTRRFDGPGPGGRDVSHGVNVYLRGAEGAERKIAVWYARGVDETKRGHSKQCGPISMSLIRPNIS
jgi:hypothetical protein